MKKFWTSMLALVFCMSMFLTGCGAADEEPVTDSGNGETEISLSLDETASYEGVCDATLKACEVLDDKARAEGWWYYYTDTLDNPAPALEWKVSEGNYTSVRAVVEIKNTSGEPQTYADKINAQLFYQENGEAETIYFDGTAMQRNPGQKDKDGYDIASTKCAEIAPGETTFVDIIVDVPKDVYEGIAETAEGESTGIFEKIEYNLGDGTTFIINLVSNLTLASDAE